MEKVSWVKRLGQTPEKGRCMDLCRLSGNLSDRERKEGIPGNRKAAVADMWRSEMSHSEKNEWLCIAGV